MENKHFEDVLKKALDGAEMPPSDAVWSSIESDLIVSENVSLKRSVVFYKWVATVSVLLALLAGGLYVKRENILLPANIATKIISKKSAPGNIVKIDGHAKTGTEGHEVQTERATLASNNNSRRTMSPDRGPVTTDSSNDVSHKRSTSEDRSPASASTSSSGHPFADEEIAILPSLPSMILSPTSAQTLPDSSVSIVVASSPYFSADMLASSTDTSAASDSAKFPDVLKKTLSPKNELPVIKESGHGNDFWIAVGASAGSYSPNMKSEASINPPLARPGSGSVTANQKQGTFHSVTLLAGYQILPHWVIQAGVSYVNQTGRATSEIVSRPSPTVPNFNSIFSIVTPMSYPLTNSMDFVSVPVLIGYKLTGNHATIILSGGASSNIFIRNTLTDPTGSLGTVTKGHGKNSPYRNVSWSGLFNAEFSYGISRRVRFAVVPGLRYGINASLKSNADRPFILDIGLRLRYAIF